jgi:glycosyltransferase involved in cell wall biosynthesis
MRVAVIIPDRGDRPLFMENCLRMVRAQTLGASIIVVDSPPKDDSCDIVPRIRTAYNFFDSYDTDVIAIMENDDWYAPDYLEKMVEAWQRFEKPDLFGTCYTIYYHMQLRGYFTMEHHQRASLMNTLIKPGLNFEWPVDIEPYLDLHLWKTIPNRIVFRPEKHISIGMKHGVGKCGGESHVIDQRMIKRFSNPDNGFLKETLDPESFEFYNNYFKS